MTERAFLREIEFEGQLLSRVGREGAVHGLYILCQLKRKGALRDLVEH
jgi:hypothetical protein